MNLTDKEKEKAQQFYEDHKNCESISSMGGKFSFIITPTGLGDCVCIRCNSCKATKDITDIESW